LRSEGLAEDPIPLIVTELMEDAWLLCFDEFQVLCKQCVQLAALLLCCSAPTRSSWCSVDGTLAAHSLLHTLTAHTHCCALSLLRTLTAHSHCCALSLRTLTAHSHCALSLRTLSLRTLSLRTLWRLIAGP
jgi:hypothetical protein